MQLAQTMISRRITNAFWFISNQNIHNDLNIPYIVDVIYGNLFILSIPNLCQRLIQFESISILTAPIVIYFHIYFRITFALFSTIAAIYPNFAGGRFLGLMTPSFVRYDARVKAKGIQGFPTPIVRPSPRRPCRHRHRHGLKWRRPGIDKEFSAVERNQRWNCYVMDLQYDVERIEQFSISNTSASDTCEWTCYRYDTRSWVSANKEDKLS